MINAQQLSRIMPHLSAVKAEEFVPLLNTAMAEFEIDKSFARQAAFLAQLAHESGELRWFEEFATGAAYEDRTDLGNNQPGDGERFKGRGPIQLTGRANYRAAGRALGLPLEAEPLRAKEPQIGFRVAGWFWKSHGCNELADKNDFRGITKKINGGFNGMTQREVFYERAKAAFGFC